MAKPELVIRRPMKGATVRMTIRVRIHPEARVRTFVAGRFLRLAGVCTAAAARVLGARVGTGLSAANDRRRKTELWAAVNAYAEACGGDTGPPPTERRIVAVVAVERAAEGYGEHG